MIATRCIPGILALLGLLAPGAAQGVFWQQLAPTTGPSARSVHAMAMDLARGEIVLFGGGIGWPNWFGDTWLWQGSSWSQAQPANSPSPRGSAGLVYDLARGRVILFGGGNLNGELGDTWEWDGVDWTPIPTVGTAGARADHAMVYDSARHRTVLFGGSAGGGVHFADTWEFDGSTATWTQVTGTQPPPRRLAGMAFDSVRARVVLFGGTVGSQRLGDTWEFDGSSATWAQIFPVGSPTPRAHPAMAFDLARQRTVLFGGSDWPTTFHDDTWEWDGATWIDVTPATNPSPRHGVSRAHVYNPLTGRCFLFGGGAAQTLFADTWERSSVTPASLVPDGAGCAGSAGVPTLASDGLSMPWLGDSFAVHFGNLLASCLPFVVIGFGNASLPIPGVPGCMQLVATPIGVTGLPLNGNTAPWSMSVPNDPGLIGVMFRLQGAAVLAGGNNSFGAVVSNALEVTIGAR